MRKILIFLAIILFPTFTFASIDYNLYYGMTNNNSVKELQEFLIKKSFLTGKATGNFFSLTVSAVKKYQTSKKISATGYVGPLTRRVINADLNFAINALPAQLPGSAITTNNTATLVANSIKGALDLSVNDLYVSQSVIPPQASFKLGDFNLKNNTTENINLKNIEVTLSVGTNLYYSNMYVNKLYVVYENNKTIVLNNVTDKNNFIIDYNLPIGQTINFSVYGDINDSIPLDSSISSSLIISGISAGTSVPVSSNSEVALKGQSIVFGSASFIVEKSSSSSSNIAVINQKVNAGSFQFKANNDSYNILELKFIVPNYYVAKNISNAVLLDSATKTVLTTKPVNVVYDGSNYVLNFSVNIPVSLNSTKTITVNYDLNSVFDSNGASIDISPILVYVKATNAKNKIFDGSASKHINFISYYGGIVIPELGITANKLYAFKSIPTFESNLADGALAINNGVVDIYKFNISADKNSDIAIKQLKFIVKLNNPNLTNTRLNNFKLYKDSVDYTNSVTIGNIVNGNYIGLENQNAIGIGIDNVVVIVFDDEEIISAGNKKVYSLKATATAFTNSSKYGADSISTYMPQDTSVVVGGSILKPIMNNLYYGLVKNQNEDFYIGGYNVLWSDRSSAFPNTHNNFNSMSTNDWYNGYVTLSSSLGTQTVTAK